MGEEFDVAVIGGGPGGYVAAIRAAQLGGKVALVEKGALGGVCNNTGCIPSKTMLRLAEILNGLQFAAQFGIDIQRPAISSIDKKKLAEKRAEITGKLSNGIGFLLKSNGVQVLYGIAEIKSKNELAVQKSDGSAAVVKAKSIIIATGSSPAMPGIFKDVNNAMTGEDFLLSEELPKTALIVGGGPEGLEFASMLAGLGGEVTLVEKLSRVLPQEDTEISAAVQRALGESGVRVLAQTEVVSAEDSQAGIKAKLSSGETIEAEKAIICAGRKPNTQAIGLEAIKAKTDSRGIIIVNDRMETSVKGIYAIGDAAGGSYAHEAMENGRVAAENAMKLNSSMKGRLVPRCIYTVPEVACVGLTEEEAKGALVGRFSLKASGRAMTLGSTSGLAKVVIDRKTKKLLGVHLVNERASDMVGEALLAVNRITADEIITTIHPHPTLVETLKEAVMDAYGIAVNAISSVKGNKKEEGRKAGKTGG